MNSVSLAAAQQGDEDAFAELMKPHRAELHAHCYRMLGSLADADDALQEILLRAWRALPRFEGRSSLRSWLYTIATNVCLRMIERRPPRVLPVDYGPSVDPHVEPGNAVSEDVWLDPYPDQALSLASTPPGPEARYEQRESIELAFMAALHHLPARQRAVLILRDVLGFSADEVAGVMETTATSVYSLLQRAHKTVDERLPSHSQQATVRALGDERLREVVNSYVDAWQRGDVEAVVALLTDDVAFTMPPIPTWYQGVADVGAFLRRLPMADGRRWRILETGINAQVGLAYYGWDDSRSAFVAHGLNVLGLRGDRVASVTAYLTPEAFSRFDLKPELEG